VSSAIKSPISKISPLAGKPAPKDMLIDVAQLDREYFERRPDPNDPNQRVSFGTSGHRGSPLHGTFTEAHILAITQAICEYRKGQGTDGPLYMGKDTHAVSDPAQRTALEVLAANDVDTIIQRDNGVTPTPVISRTILAYNRGRKQHLADGIVITPSHNPPEDGGFKYNPTNGGPADTDVTRWVQDRANELLRGNNAGVKRVSFSTAINAASTHQEDFVLPYVRDLRNVIDMEAVRGAGLKLGVDPLGGSSLPYWEPINAEYGLEIKIVNPVIDPTFSFMTVDHDGVIRMDCSSPYAMARRNRHALLGSDEPEPLPCRGHRLSAHASPAVGAAHRGGQDTGKQQHDRPGGAEAGSPAERGSRGIQVVRAGALRWVLLLRWGRKRWSEFPAARWHRMGHR
jgi:phosphoglucomutase